jgi:hypothetical protein
MAEFLVGKGIPDYITSLPTTVLNTPFGQMFKARMDASRQDIGYSQGYSQGNFQ